MNISAVIVTRGDQDISAIQKSLYGCMDEVIVWDNSRALDLRVYGRYIGALAARNETIFIQDDDCIVPALQIVGSYIDLGVSQNGFPYIVSNVPEDRRKPCIPWNITLVGWGTVFTKASMGVFNQYLRKHPQDELFLRECDRVFSHLNRDIIHLVDHGVVHAPYAYGDDRMGREPQHGSDLAAIHKRLCTL